MNAGALSTQDKLYKVTVRATVALVAIAAILLFSFDSQTPLNLKISSIAAGLSSSILYTLVFNWQTNREQANLIKNQINAEFETHTSTLVNQISRMTDSYMPSSEYPGTPGFDARFNKDIQSDLENSKTYTFRGASAKYVPARLKAKRNSIELVRIIINHPGDDNAIRRRVADRSLNPKYNGQSMEALRKDIQNEITASIIALFDLRSHYLIQISLTKNDPSVTRIEVLDNACYISLYRSAQSQAYPETLRYATGSTMNDIFRLQTIRQFEDSERIEFSSRSTEKDLLNVLNSLNGQPYETEKIEEFRKSSSQFCENFAKQLTNL